MPQAACRWEAESRRSWGRWRLVRDGREAARLRLRGWGAGGATLDFSGGAWSLGTEGIVRWRIRLLDARGVERARMPLDWRGKGTVRWADGREYEWVAESWWASRYLLRRRGGGDVARVVGEGWFRLDANVELLDDSMPDDTLVPLLALGWYAAVLMTAGSSVVVTG